MMKRNTEFIAALSLGLVLWTVPAHAQQRPGDDWTTVLTYVAATATTSGKIVAVGEGGALMTSADGGASWSFGQIEVNGNPVSGCVTTIYQVPGGALVVVLVRLKEGGGGTFTYEASSDFVTSTDDGVTWSLSPFPRTSAVFRGNGVTYHGVNISGLVEGPGGELLAYGTISGSNNIFTVWHLGGLIFREAGGSWEQAMFEYGPIRKIAEANGRATTPCSIPSTGRAGTATRWTGRRSRWTDRPWMRRRFPACG